MKTIMNTTIITHRTDATADGKVIYAYNGFRAGGHYRAETSLNCASPRAAVTAALEEIKTGRWIACAVHHNGRILRDWPDLSQLMRSLGI